MNREFNASSRRARSILAFVAVLTSLLVLGSIDGLSSTTVPSRSWQARDRS